MSNSDYPEVGDCIRITFGAIDDRSNPLTGRVTGVGTDPGIADVELFFVLDSESEYQSIECYEGEVNGETQLSVVRGNSSEKLSDTADWEVIS